jgi:hypothetical protein
MDGGQSSSLLMQCTTGRGLGDVTYINGVAHVDSSELRMLVAKFQEKDKAEALEREAEHSEECARRKGGSPFGGGPHKATGTQG